MRTPSLVTLLLLATPSPTSGWISTSQSRYAASLEDITAATRGLSTANAYRSLGWLFNAPADPLDTSGFGGSLTWALDPAVCDNILPHVRETFWTMSFVGCEDLALSMRRAFAAFVRGGDMP